MIYHSHTGNVHTQHIPAMWRRISRDSLSCQKWRPQKEWLFKQRVWLHHRVEKDWAASLQRCVLHPTLSASHWWPRGSGTSLSFPHCFSLFLFLCPFFHLQYIHCRKRYRHSYSTNTSWHVITSPLCKSHHNPFHLLDPETEHSDLQTSSRMCLVSSSTRN